MAIHISRQVLLKLKDKHRVTEAEVRQCFQNAEGTYLRDLRERHGTVPPTYWFIAETNHRRTLKIVFIASRDAMTGKTRIDIKTAYAPNQTEIAIYLRHGRD